MSEFGDGPTVNFVLHEAAEKNDAAAIVAALAAEEEMDYDPSAPNANAFLSVGTAGGVGVGIGVGVAM